MRKNAASPKPDPKPVSKSGAKPRKRAAPAKDNIGVSSVGPGSAVAAGRNARALVVNVLGGYWPVAVLGIVLALGAAGYFAWRQLFPQKMVGDFRIAVAGFAVKGQSSAGQDLAQNVYLGLSSNLSELSKQFTITIWSPDRVGMVQGDSAEARAQSAQRIADRIGADVVVYGAIDTTQPTWQVAPEFYVGSADFHDAQEITGQHQMGEPFSLSGQGDLTSRVELRNKMEARTRVISKIALGLAYYSLRDYQQALSTFQDAESVPGWTDNQGRAVLYLLEGNAAAKAGVLPNAIDYLNKSLAINPEYARPLVSLGSVYYLQAVPAADSGKGPADIDLSLVAQAIAQYQRALKARDQPALSDISSKVAFGLGQCYLAQVLAGGAKSMDPAVREFKSVIADYQTNPRLRELAAESHARLGLIDALTGDKADAVQEYQQAAKLLYDNPDRQKLYADRATQLQAGVTPTP